MSSAGVKPAIPSSERPQTHVNARPLESAPSTNSDNIVIVIIIITIIIIITETEGILTAIHDQVTLTRNWKQPDTDELCRRCGKESETI